MLNFIKTHKKASIIVASIIVASLLVLTMLATVVLSLTLWRDTKNVEHSTIGQTIVKVIPAKEETISVMVTPATSKWWDIINFYTPSLNLKMVDFDKLPAKPNNLAWSLSNTDAETVGNSIGLNTVFLEYNTAEEATQVKEYLLPLSQSGFQAAAVENMVLLIPMFANTTDNYDLKNFKAATPSTPLTDTAFWNINFPALGNYFATHTTAENNKVNGVMFNAMGFLNNDIIWKGQSVDGLKWVGETNNPMFDAKNLNTKLLETTVLATQKFKPLAPLPEGETLDSLTKKGIEVLGTNELNQAKVLQALTITSKDNAWGMRSNNDYTGLVEAEKTSTAGITFTITPNVFASVLMGNSKTAPPYTGFSAVSINFVSTSNQVNIDFTVGAWADQISF